MERQQGGLLEAVERQQGGFQSLTGSCGETAGMVSRLSREAYWKLWRDSREGFKALLEAVERQQGDFQAHWML